MRVIRGPIPVLGLAVAGLVAAAGAAQAQVTDADVGLNPTNEQTGPTTVTPTGGFFSARAFVNSAGDFTGGTLTYGGAGSPQTLGFVPSDVAWEFGAGDFLFKLTNPVSDGRLHVRVDRRESGAGVGQRKLCRGRVFKHARAHCGFLYWTSGPERRRSLFCRLQQHGG
jgi:hypothetical protein